MGQATSEEDVANRIGLIEERPEQLLCVADVEGAILGYAWAQDYGPHLRSGESVIRIHDLFVRAEERRHGVGSALFSHVRRWADERGAAYIQWQASPAALPFYRSLGLTGDPCPDPDHPFFEIILEGGTGPTS
ncbi:GNAT family N-acetyltransferase [soil metagenome]